MKRSLIVLTLIAVVALPFLLRPEQAAASRADETLVIITPHNEAIRYEFGRAFSAWYQQRTGRSIAIDWRIVGGTSDIARFLEGEYTAAFENYWTRQLRRPWSAAVQAGFQAARLPADAPEIVQEARAAFRASEVGCGIDLFFGGGTYDFERQAAAGRLVDSGLRQRRPEWFTDATIPRRFGGEDYWHPEGLWMGTVLSSYGILYNRDSLERLGIERAPTQWDDLGDPRLVGEVALADPTKSGSVAKGFENILQQQMQRRLQALEHDEPGLSPEARETRAVHEGWAAGMRLIQRIGANARYFTDTSQKPPIDVAAGNCAAGLCIDFYGRQQHEAVKRRGNSERVAYVSPEGGAVSSVDPIALLRGAPNREAAIAFIEFVMSLDGQKLWNFRPGTPGGPQRFALRRLPVRRDFYAQPGWEAHRSDPGESPYEQQNPLIYRDAWTGRYFREMAFLVRILCQDTHRELQEAWRAIVAAPPGARERALAHLQDLELISYEQTTTTIRARLSARDKVEEVRLARELAEKLRLRYREARALAASQDPA